MCILPPSNLSDPNSFANIHEIKTSHIHLDLTVAFSEKELKGRVILSLQAVSGVVKEVVLDTKCIDIVHIHRISTEKKVELKYELDKEDGMYGSELRIVLDQPVLMDESIEIEIYYHTTSKCTAVQWLSPEQTVGKSHPYMFTQCQAIHARSLLPCQDTPNVKITYSAEIKVPFPLIAVMSALGVGSVENQGNVSMFKFDQPNAIPSYLIALAVGHLTSKDIGPRSRVWSEPEVIEAAAWEFADTETFIATGENLLTPYKWNRYDLLLLPASFPYGGMENPCLTFVTSTLLAGDRSLVDVIAHEIAHSWMGNLVTTANWEHFWLNEGFTMFIERKIIGRLHGDPAMHFSALIGLKALKESIDHYKEIDKMEYTALVPSLKNVDPDDVFSSIPYEKGFNFLFYLENLLGGPSVFEPFVKSYVQKFAGQSISTLDFKEYLFEYFSNQESKRKIDTVDFETWFYGAGMPPVANKYNTSLAVACEHLATSWDAARNTLIISDFQPEDLNPFSTSQKIVFLEKLLEKEAFPVPLLQEMDKTYKLSDYNNAEIKFRWQWLCLQAQWDWIFPQVVAFITSVGRMKFVRPLYSVEYCRSLSKCKNEGFELAKKTYLENAHFYHPICSQMISKDLGLTL